MKTGVYYSPEHNKIYLYQWVIDANDITHWQVSHKDQDFNALYVIGFLNIYDWVYLGEY